MYLQWRFLCGPQLNSRKLYASHMCLIPNTQANIHSNLWEWAIALYSVMDIVYIFLILLIPSFLHKCKHAKTVCHNYSYAKRQNNQSTWVLGISHMGLRYNVLEFNWGLHRFGWVKAWIVGMNRMCTASDSALPNFTLFQFFRMKLCSTQEKVLHIHKIHHIQMSNAQIWMNTHFKFRYTPSVAILQLSSMQLSSTQHPLLHIHKIHHAYTIYIMHTQYIMSHQPINRDAFRLYAASR